MAELIGMRGRLCDAARQIEYTVEVVNVREAYGKVQVKVTPLSGAGQTWVRVDSLAELKLPAATT